MIISDDVHKDFAALLQAGCSIRFDGIRSMYGVVYVTVTVTPNKPGLADLLASDVSRGSPVVGKFTFSLPDGEGFEEGLRHARLLHASVPRDFRDGSASH